MDPYKKLVLEFLNEDFVENYDYHRECVDKINNDLHEQAINFTYSYDEYCKELMERFLMTIDKYFTTHETATDFFDSYEKIVFNTFEQMKSSKCAAYKDGSKLSV